VLFFVIVPLYLISVNIGMQANNEAQRSIIDFTQQNLRFLVGNIEREFGNAIIRQHEMVNNRDLQAIIAHGDMPLSFEIARSNSDLKRQLQQIVLESNYIERATIYIPNTMRRISSEGVGRLTQRDIEFIEKAVGIVPYGPFMQVDDKVYVIFSPLISIEEETLYIISMEIYLPLLEQTLQDFLESEHGNIILIGREGGIDVWNGIDDSLFGNLQYFVNFFDMETDVWESQQYLAIGHKSNMLNTTFVAYFYRTQFFGQITRHINWLWILTAYLMMLIVIIVFIIKRMISAPLQKLTDGFAKVAQGDFNIELQYSGNDEFGYAYKTFNEVATQHKQMIEQVYEQKIHAQSAELKQMQYQINPHFLYNSHYLIQIMSLSRDYEAIDRLSKHLGAFYRYITKGTMNEVTLSEEVANAKDYLEVQVMRFRDRVNVTFDEIPEGFENFKMPKLILQPLIENAYSHGMEKIVKHGVLKVSIKSENNFLIITVEDNGNCVNEETVKSINERLTKLDKNVEITGLINVHRRIRIRFGENSGIFVSRSEFGGFKADLKMEVKRGCTDC